MGNKWAPYQEFASIVEILLSAGGSKDNEKPWLLSGP